MPRFRLDLEYEGTRYRGWQVQPNARTVQGDLMAAVEQVFQTRAFELQGSGRTDAGVHAIQQTAHLQVPTTLPPTRIRHQINDLLPADVNVLKVRPAAPSFHARHDALTRTYLYQIARRRTAFGKRFVWWVKDALDPRPMADAAALLVGMHDFRSFTADMPSQKDTRVEVQALTVHEAGDMLLVRMTASHFLWKMVRQIVGVLVEVGRGKLKPPAVGQFLKTPSDLPARLTAPPSGLFLERAWYPGEKRDDEVRPLLWMPRP